jgi:hypothetical protein
VDTLYSTTLLVALISGGAGVLTLVQLALGRRKQPLLARALARTALYCGVLALAAGLLSLGVHFFSGHGPDSPEPMRALAFLAHHRAYWAVAVLAALSLYSWRRALRYATQATRPTTTSSSVNGR